MMWDRWDIVSAHYAYCADHHGGQASPEYARLCRIARYFSPGSCWRGYDSLTENGQAIYADIVARGGPR